MEHSRTPTHIAQKGSTTFEIGRTTEDDNSTGPDSGETRVATAKAKTELCSGWLAADLSYPKRDAEHSGTASRAENR